MGSRPRIPKMKNKKNHAEFSAPTSYKIEEGGVEYEFESCPGYPGGWMITSEEKSVTVGTVRYINGVLIYAARADILGWFMKTLVFWRVVK